MFKADNIGFTLMEPVTVISVLGILAAMAEPKYFSIKFKAEIDILTDLI